MRTIVIGVGHLGRHHARIVHESPRAELVGVVDVDKDRGREIAEPFGAPVYGDASEVPGAIDAAVVAVPTSFHETVAAPLIERGIALLVEKPLAADVAASERLVDAAEAKGTVLQVGHVERFNPAVMAISAMNLTPVYIEARRISPFTMRSADVGVVIDLMIHDLDIVQHLVDRPLVKTEALGVGVITGKEDMANARLTFETGAVADISASRLALKTERRIRLFSRDGYVSLDYVAKKGVVYRVDPSLKLSEFGKSGIEALRDPLGGGVPDLFQRGLLKMDTLTMGDHEPLAKQFESFAAAVLDGEAPAVDGRAGLDAVRTAAEVQSCVVGFAHQFESTNPR